MRRALQCACSFARPCQWSYQYDAIHPCAIALALPASVIGDSRAHSYLYGFQRRRRVHITLELSWSADRAIQQLGRSHRCVFSVCAHVLKGLADAGKCSGEAIHGMVSFHLVDQRKLFGARATWLDFLRVCAFSRCWLWCARATTLAYVQLHTLHILPSRRTDQTSAPLYKLVVAALPGEVRTHTAACELTAQVLREHQSL